MTNFSMASISMTPIGVVHSSRKVVEDDNWDQEHVYVELDPSHVTSEALEGLEDSSHVEILFFMNQIGSAICKIAKVAGLKLRLEGLDAVDGTPVLGIKPWVHEFAPQGAAVRRDQLSQKMLNLELLPETLAIAKLNPHSQLPEWAQRSSFFSVSKTPDELSIVCRQEDIPPEVIGESDVEIHVEADWRAFKVQGPLEFALTGVLASIAQPLAYAGISIFSISTFDTDYVLVKQKHLVDAANVLSAAGHTVGPTHVSTKGGV